MSIRKFREKIDKEAKIVSKDKDNEVLFAFRHSSKKHDLTFVTEGNWELFSYILSTNKNYVNHTEESIKDLDNMREIILNTAINICENNEMYKRKVVKHLTK